MSDTHLKIELQRDGKTKYSRKGSRRDVVQIITSAMKADPTILTAVGLSFFHFFKQHGGVMIDKEEGKVYMVSEQSLEDFERNNPKPN